MRELKNYQWPQCFVNSAKYVNKDNIKLENKLRKEIEYFFSNKFDYEVKLFPSARSCIGAILEFNNINRQNEVYVNKWVSNCLFNTVGLYSNPTINLVRPDLIILNNQWGVSQKIFKNIKKKKTIIVDDSCDSLILKKNALFPNNSEYEFFSLPKLIGCVSGGVIISRNKKFLNFCNQRQKKNKKFGKQQSKLKFLETNKKNIFDYRYNEATNTYLDFSGLKNIHENLKNFDRNKNIIIRRIKILSKYLKLDIDQNRLGPLIAIDKKLIKNTKEVKDNFIFRHKLINYRRNVSKKYLLLPVHFKITEEKFFKLIKILKKNL